MINLMKRLAELDAKNSNVIKQGVTEGSQGDYTFTTVLDDDREIIVTYDYISGEPSKYSGTLASPGRSPDIQIISVTDSETGEDVSNMVDIKNLIQRAWINYEEKHQQDDRYEGVAEGVDGSDDFYNFANLFSDPNEYTHPDPKEAVEFITSQGRDPKDTIRNIIKFAQSNPDKLNDSAVENAVKSLMSQGVAESLEECGMMDSGMSQPHSPASINMTAATGEELSSMLKDIMTLAGRSMSDPMKGANGVAVVDVEPSTDMDMGSSNDARTDEPSIMRSMMDKLNPPGNDDEEFKKTDETINSLAAPKAFPVPPGTQDAAGSPGAGAGRNMVNNPIATPKEETTFESLMADYRKFVAEGMKVQAVD